MKINQDINTDHHDEPDMELKVVYRDGKKVWPPEDPVDIHDEISKGFDRIEKVMREESAKMAEIIRQAVVQNTYPYSTASPQVVWTNYIPEACRSCTNHPSNGRSGICHCTLGSPKVTSGMVWIDNLEHQPNFYSTTASTDFPWKGDK